MEKIKNLGVSAMREKKKKKPFYRKWWFIPVCVFSILVAITSGMRDASEEVIDENLVANEQTTSVAVAKPTKKSTTRDNSKAVLTSLYTGTFVVGEDIPAGRYTITGSGSGNLFIYENGIPFINEILMGSRSDFDLGVPSVTVDIKDGNEIEISGINNVIFTPATTELSTTLSTGYWVVGLDIPAGTYEATCNDGESGNFFVYNGKFPVVNEILDKSDMGFGVEKVRVSLKDQQIIHISGLSTVIFK
jgi:hypothetical protein